MLALLRIARLTHPYTLASRSTPSPFGSLFAMPMARPLAFGVPPTSLRSSPLISPLLPMRGSPLSGFGASARGSLLLCEMRKLRNSSNARSGILLRVDVIFRMHCEMNCRRAAESSDEVLDVGQNSPLTNLFVLSIFGLSKRSLLVPVSRTLPFSK